MKKQYELLISQLRALIQGESNRVGVLANATALLKQTFPERFFWVGFYMVADGELQLGPFQGTVACYHIGKGRGVCGTAWAEQRTLIVPDVEQFPGHIACSSESRSEIVVPLIGKDNNVVGVLDIDSTALNAFDETDQLYLEQTAKILTEALAY